MSAPARGEVWDVVIVGGGPAGLAAAEIAAARGRGVLVLEQKPSLGRKLLMAGKSGLNLTMEMAAERFVNAYRGSHADAVCAAVSAFGPAQLRAWAAGLGVETFVGSSGKIFPKELKASPLLRAWIARLQRMGVSVRTRARLIGLERETDPACWRLDVETSQRADGLALETQQTALRAKAVLLAMGGASWPRLGSDGMWRPMLTEMGVDQQPLAASNVGWNIAWSDIFRARFAGAPLKNIALRVGEHSMRGELTVTDYGLEGGPLYALRAEIERAQGRCALDLAPDRSLSAIQAGLAQPPGKASLSNWLRKRSGLDPAKIGLLRECASIGATPALATRIKALPLQLGDKRPIAEAISCAGGVSGAALDADHMLRCAPGVFCAGEMTDWDAPTGGWLLTGCMALGRAAGASAAAWSLAAPTPS
ncbi:MAG: TIGR03862 family flavoprotein [Neomegalonema sp.]|nr:TIGR03862 family flavoprotein [Neomegalonema sp.]